MYLNIFLLVNPDLHKFLNLRCCFNYLEPNLIFQYYLV